MKNCDESVKINHNSNWPYVPDHSYKIFTIGVSGSGKTNVFNRYHCVHFWLIDTNVSP